MKPFVPLCSDQYEAKLRDRRIVLVAAIREHLHRGDDPAKLSLLNYLDTNGDPAEADLLAETDIAVITRELAELREIDAALRRIADKSYGVCISCGSNIDPKRLNVQPTAQSCVPCCTAFEKTHGVARHARI